MQYAYLNPCQAQGRAANQRESNMETASILFQFILLACVGFVALFGIGCTLQGPNAPTVMATISAIVLFGIALYLI